MNPPPHSQTDIVLSVIGFLPALPTMYFFTGSFLKYELHLLPSADILVPPPIVMIGGLLLAILLNLYPLIRQSAGKPDSVFWWSTALTAVRWNVMTVLLSTLFLSLLFGYVLVENYLEMGR